MPLTPLRTFCLLLLVSFIFCETSLNRCQFQARDNSIYDLSSLISFTDFSFSTRLAEYHFAVCRQTHMCQGAACATPTSESPIVVGDIRAMDWSEEYTNEGNGISLVYGNGESLCGESSARFIVTVQCDESTDAHLSSFEPGCEENHVIMKSRFACPVRSDTSESSEKTVTSQLPELWGLWVLVGAGVGSVLVSCVFLGVCVLVCLYKGNKKERKDDQEAFMGANYAYEKVTYPLEP